METAEAHTRVQAHAIMERGQTEEEIILAFMVSDEALEDAANTNFSLGNCTDARTCPVPSRCFGGAVAASSENVI